MAGTRSRSPRCCCEACVCILCEAGCFVDTNMSFEHNGNTMAVDGPGIITGGFSRYSDDIPNYITGACPGSGTCCDDNPYLQEACVFTAGYVDGDGTTWEFAFFFYLEVGTTTIRLRTYAWAIPASLVGDAHYIVDEEVSATETMDCGAEQEYSQALDRCAASGDGLGFPSTINTILTVAAS